MFNLRRNRPSPAEIARVHQQNLQQNLERRLEAARAQGNSELIRQLEAEHEYLSK